MVFGDERGVGAQEHLGFAKLDALYSHSLIFLSVKIRIFLSRLAETT